MATPLDELSNPYLAFVPKPKGDPKGLNLSPEWIAEANAQELRMQPGNLAEAEAQLTRMPAGHPQRAVLEEEIKTLKGQTPTVEENPYIKFVKGSKPVREAPAEKSYPTPGEEFFHEVGAKAVGSLAQISDMFTSTAKQLLGPAVYWGARTGVQIATGEPATAATAGQMAKDFFFPPEVSTPWAVVAERLGPEAQKAYNENPIGWVMGKISEVIEKGADKLTEGSTKLQAPDVVTLVEQFMGSMMYKGMKPALQASLRNRLEAFKEKAAVASPADTAKGPSVQDAAADQAFQDAMKEFGIEDAAVAEKTLPEAARPKEVAALLQKVSEEPPVVVEVGEPPRKIATPEISALFKQYPLAATAAGVTAATVLALSEPNWENMGLAAVMVAGMPKKPGGMWHPEAVKRLAEPLKDKLTQGVGVPMLGSAELQALPNISAREAAQQTQRRKTAEMRAPLIAWSESRIKTYLNKHAGTETDPLKDVKIPMAGDEATWGDVMDKAVSQRPAKTYTDLEGSKTPAEENVFGISAGADSTRALTSALAHVGDYLREFVPAEKLGQYDLVRAVKETAAQDAKQAAKMAKARASGEGTVPYKTYPDGMKWVEVKSEDALKNEGDVMGHCVGGYCEAVHSGESRVYSLRDTKGMSHVTVEVAPRNVGDIEAADVAHLPLELQRQMAELPPEEANKLIQEHFPADINQIKGKQNRAPIAEYLPYVQDFVKGGKWGEVGDLENTGLVKDFEGKYVTPEEVKAQGILGGRERGSASPDLLKSIALVGGGAALLAAADPQSWKSAAALGAVIGLGVAKFPWGKAGTGLDKGLGMMSTRVLNIDPAIHRAWIKFEFSNMQRASAMKSVAEPFLVEASKVGGKLGEELNLATLSNDPIAINAAIAATGNPKLAQGWAVVRAMLDQTGQLLQSTKRIATLLPDYFPRVVKDLDGLLGKLGAQTKGELQKALLEREAKLGRPLTQEEASKVVNNFLLTPFRNGGQPGWAKGRTIKQVTAELAPFYLNMTDSLHAYIHSTALEIELSKFFGKDAHLTQKGGQSYLNVDASIGGITDRLQAAGKLDRAQALELRAMLQARLGPGEWGSGPVVQGIRNVTNAMLLANPLSGILQFGDIAPTVALHGIMPTLSSISQILTGRATIRPKDVGVLNHIVDELVSAGKTAKFLQSALKFGGFSLPDYLGKMTNLNAVKTKFEDWSQTPKGQQKIVEKYSAAYGMDLPQLLTDLKARKLTPLTREFYFTELSRVQPLSKFETTQLHAENAVSLGVADVRSLYQLRSFMMKQLDLLRREGYNEIKNGFANKSPVQVTSGLYNLTKISMALGISGALPVMVTNYLLGKPFDSQWSDIPLNMLKTFGWSQYVMDQARKGHPLEAAFKAIVPPYQMYEEILRRDPAATKYLPVAGKVLFQQEWTAGGKARGEEKRDKEKLREINRDKPLFGEPSPDLLQDIRGRRREVTRSQGYRERQRERRQKKLEAR